MKLSPVERIKLLELLPERGSFHNLKIIRKLKETLSFSEDELGLCHITIEYRCPNRDEKGRRCESNGYFSAAPICSEHKMMLVPTGLTSFNFDRKFGEKEIVMGMEALRTSGEALKIASSQNLLSEQHISLYEKFFPEERTEIPEMIKNAME